MEYNNVVLLSAHIVDDKVLAMYSSLARELDGYDIVLLLNCEKEHCADIPDEVSVYRSDSESINSLMYNPIADTLLPGSCHFPVLRFFLDNPQYRHYWFIEYDVVFTGKWNTLMDDCDSNLKDYDFLSCHIEKYGEENKIWAWWYRDNNYGYALEECVKGFNPVCRYSNKALALLDSYLKKGHSAHSEVMITTCLYNHGMKIGDIGGISEFNPKDFRNRYYIKGLGIHNGTMRWRPPFTMEEIEALGTKNRLFHPIK